MSWLIAIGNFFYEILFGCHHEHVTRPFTLKNEIYAYKVCLDCGKQIPYSAERMSPLSSRETQRLKASALGGVRIMPDRTWKQTPAPVPVPVSVRADDGNAAA